MDLETIATALDFSWMQEKINKILDFSKKSIPQKINLSKKKSQFLEKIDSLKNQFLDFSKKSIPRKNNFSKK